MTEEKEMTQPSAVSTGDKPLPPTGIVYGSIIGAILTLVCAVITLVVTIAKITIDPVLQIALWWISWVFLIAVVILTFIGTSKKYRPAKPVIIAGLMGLAGAIILLVCVFIN